MECFPFEAWIGLLRKDKRHGQSTNPKPVSGAEGISLTRECHKGECERLEIAQETDNMPMP
jgi:hypothetical protein